MLEVSMHRQTHAHSIIPERTQSSMIETVTPRSERSERSDQSKQFNEHLSSASSSSTSMSSEKSIRAEIQVLSIPQASTVQVPLSPLPLEDQGSRKSERQMKARDF